MPVLSKSRHEQFAQFVAKGLSAKEAYISAGYAKAGAAQNASRLITNEQVSRRIEELQTKISAGVVQLAIRERSARVQVLQDNLDRMRQVIAARAFEYAAHPGGSSGLLVKDYRGKNAEKEIWKFDAALVSQIHHALKQAALEEGQWNQKRDTSNEAADLVARLNAGRRRAAAAAAAEEKARALADGKYGASEPKGA
jgi:hypothetical protein